MTIEFSTTQTSAYSGSAVQGTFTRGVGFTQSVVVSVTPIEEEEFSVTDISVVLLGEQDPITITVDEPVITFDGTYLSGWDDVFTYVPVGESNRTTNPIEVTLNDLPGGQNLYDLDQDQQHFISRIYEVTVTYTGNVSQEATTETVDLIHEVFNDLESIRSFMANYEYGGG